jgi:4-coumarate--CoA ligase
MTEVGISTQVPKSVINTISLKSVGPPVPGCQIKIVDTDTRKLLPPYQVGEICIKSTQVTPGYYKLPKITEQTFDSEGFIKSGDAGYYDEQNNLYIVGRYKDIIKVNTIQVSPTELEQLLVSHEAVKEAAVIGIPDEEMDEVPKAFVVIRDGYKIDEESLKLFIKERVNPIKQLYGGVVFMKRLPKISIGKVDKNALKKFSETKQ